MPFWYIKQCQIIEEYSMVILGSFHRIHTSMILLPDYFQATLLWYFVLYCDFLFKLLSSLPVRDGKLSYGC